jgi:glutamate 5-kinase
MDHQKQNSSLHLSLHAVRRVVIKLGTSIVTKETGGFNTGLVGPIVREIARFRRAGKQVVLVSSGAVGLGAFHLSLASERRNDVVTKQACAAVGQSLLMHAYEALFRAHRIKIAQVLLTEEDFTDWDRYQNLRRTMEKLLKLGVLPVVNENDTVSIAEIKNLGRNGQRVFSDNDRLAALVTSKLGADLLILLTDVDGLQSRSAGGTNGNQSPVIPLVTDTTKDVKALAAGPSQFGRGGMITKLEAAEIAMRAGTVIIANGTRRDTLPWILKGEAVGTVFDSSSRLRGKKRWIAFASNTRGTVEINQGARAALLRGKASLLVSGVVRVINDFAVQDVVSIVDTEGREFARGIVNFNSLEALRLMGSKDKQRQRAKDQVLIARNNLVVTDEGVSL